MNFVSDFQDRETDVILMIIAKIRVFLENNIQQHSHCHNNTLLVTAKQGGIKHTRLVLTDLVSSALIDDLYPCCN